MRYRDPSLPIDARIDDLLERMTPEEKVGQLMQYDGRHPRVLELVSEQHIGSILCVLGEGQVKAICEAALKTRLGIPLLVGIDAIHGHSSWYGATMFPSQLGLSCAWDEGLCERVARATAVEMTHTGAHWNFSPVFCLARDLRWGRTGETFGEDGLMIGKLGAAMVRGYQGKDLKDPTSVAACAKHYAGYGDSEGGRDASESDHSRRKMRALFLPPFREAVKAGCASFMTAYHAIDGVSCVYNRWLLTEVLRGEWGADTMVVTDWDIVGRQVRDRKTAATYEEASARTLNAGNDLIMTTPQFYEATLANLQRGSVTMATLDEAVRRVLRLKFRLGLFENPRLPSDAAAARVVGIPEHRQLALQAARESAVLLRNRGGTLPLDGRRLRRVALVGPLADDDLQQNGDWSLGAGQGQGIMARHPRGCTTTVADGLRALLPPETHLTCVRGCNTDVRDPGLDRIPHAVQAATGADACVLVLGDTLPYVGETKSCATLELPGGQRALFEALAATGVPLIVVLMTSKPLAVPWIESRADAVLVSHTPGMEGGRAIAEILLGQINPQGRLTMSWPHHVGQQPVRYDLLPGAHQQGYPDLPDAGFNPVFAFGEGISYTAWKYEGLRLAANRLARGQALELSLNIWNTGERAGVETVQVYIRDLATSVTWPMQRLRAWKQVHLPSGACERVTFTIAYDDLALCDETGAWVVEPGEFEVVVADCSRTVRGWGSNRLVAPFTVV